MRSAYSTRFNDKNEHVLKSGTCNLYQKKFRGSFLFPFRYYYCITLQHYGNASYRIRFSGSNYKYFFLNVEFHVNVCVSNMACETVISVQRSQTKYYRLAHRTSNYTTTQLTHTCWQIIEVDYNSQICLPKWTWTSWTLCGFELVLNFWYDCIIYLPITDWYNWPANNTCMDGRLTFVCVLVLSYTRPAWLLPHSFIKLYVRDW